MDQPTAQFLGVSLRTRSGQQDATSSRISSLIYSIRPQPSMKVRMPAM
jgi:hypothetical protein